MHYNPFELYAKFSIVKLDWKNRRKLVNIRQSRNGDRANERDCVYVHLQLSFAYKYWFTLHNYLVSSYNIRGVFSRLKAVINEREDEKRISKAKNDTKTRKKMKDEEGQMMKRKTRNKKRIEDERWHKDENC